MSHQKIPFPINTITCTTCGDNDITDGAIFCGTCRSSLSEPKSVVFKTVHCPQCNAFCQPGEAFCGDCGWSIPQKQLVTPEPRRTVSCSLCNTDNPAEATFCENCGTPTSKPLVFKDVPCPQCNKVCHSDDTFCGNCGAFIPEKTVKPKPPVDKTVYCPLCGFRCQLGVVFCDNCGSSIAKETDQQLKSAPKIPNLVTFRELGKGGMSKTYLAYLETNKHKQVVIKVEQVKKNTPSFLENEAETLRKLDHPNIIEIYPLPDDEEEEEKVELAEKEEKKEQEEKIELVEKPEKKEKPEKWIGHVKDGENEYRYILLKYMHGGSLLDKLNTPPLPLAKRSEEHPLSLSKIIAMTEQITQALDYAHSKGVLHLDIKPSNVLFSYTGRQVVISDFGIAQTIKRQKGIPEPIAGTLTYMAPERLDDEELDQSADIYALGVMVGEMLSKAILHETTDAVNAKRKPIISKIEINDLPKDLQQVIRKATQEDRKKRYQTASALLAELRRAQRGFAIKQRLAGYARRLRVSRPRYTHRLQVLLAVIGVVLLFVANVLYVLWFLSEVVYVELNSVIHPLLAWLTNLPVITFMVLIILNVVAYTIYERRPTKSPIAPIPEPVVPTASPPIKTRRVKRPLSTDFGTASAPRQRATQGPRTIGHSTGYSQPPIAPAPAPAPRQVARPARPPQQAAATPARRQVAPPKFSRNEDQTVRLNLNEPLPDSIAEPDTAIEKKSDYSPLALVAMIKGSKGNPKYPLGKAYTIIGRGDDNEVPLEDQRVSSKHAEIRKERYKFTIRDLDSSNGTYVNSERVGRQILQDEDLITIGGTILRFEYTETYKMVQNFDRFWTDWSDAVNDNNLNLVEESAKQISELLARAIETRTPTDVLSLSWGRVFMLDTGVTLAEIRLPDKWPVVFSAKSNPTRDDIQHVRQELAKETGHRLSSLLIVLPLNELSEAHTRPLLTIARDRSLDIVPVAYEDLREILLFRDKRRALRRLILNYVHSSTRISPFVTKGTTGKGLFFGRERELREITEKSAFTSFAIIGGRRIGKTSILHRLHYDNLQSAGFYTLYHDCATIDSYDAFMSSAIREWQPNPPPNAPATFRELFECLPLDKSLVMLLDEADKVVPVDRDEGWRLFKKLRAEANSGRVQVVLSGERTLREGLNDVKSPLYNFANEIILGPLEYTAVQELVTRPMKQLEIELEDEKTIVQQIYDFTSGHPNIVQRLCHRLLEQIDKQSERCLTVEGVRAVVENADFQQEFLKIYWEMATDLEKIVSLLMVKDKKVCTLQTIRQALSKHCDLDPPANEINAALKALIDIRSILRRSQTGYEFAVEAFPRVVKANVTLDDLLEELAEEYEEQNQ